MQTKANILIVANEGSISSSTSDSLEGYGYTIVGTINSGEAACNYISNLLKTQLQPDLVLIDFNLSGRVNGLQTAELIGQRFNIPTLYISDHDRIESLKALTIKELYSYVVTPFSLQDWCIAIEVTLHKHRIEQELRSQEMELTNLRSQFISAVSHEFRTPLASILLSAEMLEHNWSLWTKEERDKRFQRIKQGIQRMAKLLDDILIVGREGAREIEFKPRSLDLVELCQNIVAELAISYSQRRINFAIEVSPPTVNMDENLVRHILLNLLSNAIKYSCDGSDIEFILRYSPNRNPDTLKSTSGNVTFLIRDCCIGIPPAEIKQLLTTSQRDNHVIAIAGYEGGLSSIKDAVARHGGDIDVASRDASGSTLAIDIPV